MNATKNRTSIAMRLDRGTVKQGYELTADDIGAPLSPGESFGVVMAGDVGKRCYFRDGIFQMENNEQRDKRKKPYCKPWNSGLASETSAVCRRLGRLFDSLADEINSNIAEGQIVEDVYNFRYELLQKLRAAGWTFSYGNGNKLKVRDPGHKHPFTTDALR